MIEFFFVDDVICVSQVLGLGVIVVELYGVLCGWLVVGGVFGNDWLVCVLVDDNLLLVVVDSVLG